MKFRLEAEPEELEAKGEELLKALRDGLADVAPGIAEHLAKALPRKESSLKYQVLRELKDKTSAEYERTLKRMVSAIGKVLDRGPVEKSEDGLVWVNDSTDLSKGWYCGVCGAVSPGDRCEHVTRVERRLLKALYIGPRGGKWADPEHTIPWDPEKHGGQVGFSFGKKIKTKKAKPKKDKSKAKPKDKPKQEATPVAQDKRPAEQRAKGTSQTKAEVIEREDFMAWFGDWKAGEGSRVVDAQGEPEEQYGQKPVKVFHGTAVGGFREFSKEHDKGSNLYGKGFYFTADYEVALGYTEKDEDAAPEQATGWKGPDGKEIEYLDHDQVKEILAGEGWIYKGEPGKAFAVPDEGVIHVKHPGPWQTHGNNWPTAVWAVLDSQDETGRIHLPTFLARLKEPSERALKWNKDKKYGDKVKPQGDTRSVSSVQKQLPEGSTPIVAEPQIFEVFLNIRNPFDMDRDATPEEIHEMALWQAKNERKSKERQNEQYRADIAKYHASIQKMQEELAGLERTEKNESYFVQQEEFIGYALKRIEGDQKYIERNNAYLASTDEENAKTVGLYGDDILSQDDRNAMAKVFGTDSQNYDVPINYDVLKWIKARLLATTSPTYTDHMGNEHQTIPGLRQSPPESLTWTEVNYILSDMLQDRHTLREFAESQGYDGIHHTGGWNVGTHEHDVWIAWESTQIKATNAQRFDPTSPDIYNGDEEEQLAASFQEKFDLLKALYIGPKGGKWADPEHTIPWDPEKHGRQVGLSLIPKRGESEPKVTDVVANDPVLTDEELAKSQPTHEEMLADGWVEIDEDELAKSARPHKYIRRVPYTDAKGRKRYRYYYRESAAARAAREGEVVRMGEREVNVVKIESSGDIVLQEGENEPYRVTANGWAGMLAGHFGDQFYLHAEKRARQAIAAVLRHVPSRLLADLRGDTDEARMADLRARVPDVYDRLQKAFQRAGLDVFEAKTVVGNVLERQNWQPEARALVVGAVLTPEGARLARRHRQLLDAADNLAGGAQVEPKHAAVAIDLVETNVAETAKRAERELEKLQKALHKAWKQPGDLEQKAAVLAQAMASRAVQKLQSLATAFPGLVDRAIPVARGTMLEVPSVAPHPPKQEGAEASVYVAGSGGQPKALKARYKLVEAAELIPSHNPITFQRNAGYPEKVQERAYHRDKAEQVKVANNAKQLKPAFVVNTSPDAVNGPPLVTDDGVGLGGTSRTRSMQRVYGEPSLEEQAERLKAYLEAHAHEVGLQGSDVAAMKQPVLVRVVDVEDRSTENMQLLVRQMNESFTQAMDPRTYQVAMGRRLSAKAVAALADGMETDETLRKFLDTSRSRPFVQALYDSGIIDARNMNQYMMSGTKNKLNPDGKQFVDRILVGSLLDNADLLSDTSPQLITTLALSIPYMIKAKGSGEGYDLGTDIQMAMEAYNRLQVQVREGTIDPLDPKRSDEQLQKDFENYLGDMFLGRHPALDNPRARTLLELFVRRGDKPVQMAAVFKEYVRLAGENPEGQKQLMGETLTPEQVFRHSVKAALDKEAKAEAIAAAESRETRRRQESGATAEGLLLSQDTEFDLEKAEQLGLFGKKRAQHGDKVIAIGKKGGKIYGYDPKGKPIYTPKSDKAKQRKTQTPYERYSRKAEKLGAAYDEAAKEAGKHRTLQELAVDAWDMHKKASRAARKAGDEKSAGYHRQRAGYYGDKGIEHQDEADAGRREYVPERIPPAAPPKEPEESQAPSGEKFDPLKVLLGGQAVVGPNGNKVVGYRWIHTQAEVDTGEEIVVRDVSDWDEAEQCASCGRKIVHTYLVEHKDSGKVFPYGSEHLHQALGYPRELSKQRINQIRNQVQNLDVEKQKAESLKQNYEHHIALRAVSLKEDHPDGPLGAMHARILAVKEKTPIKLDMPATFLINREQDLAMRADGLAKERFLELMADWEVATPQEIREVAQAHNPLKPVPGKVKSEPKPKTVGRSTS